MDESRTQAPSCFAQNQHISCFDFLTPDDQELFDNYKADIRYKKGETVIKQGTFASHVLYLKEGLVKIYLEGNPKDLILKISPSNFMIGLPSIFDGNSKFTYSVATYEDSVVSMIDINIFKQILKSNAAFANKVISILNEETALIYGRFFCLTMKQSHGRVADILLCLSQRVFKLKRFHLSISKNDLADLTGLSSESVIRIFKEFKDEGLIFTDGKTIEILDFDRLEKISRVS
jgi:CRP/FNR family transcriptional regulator